MFRAPQVNFYVEDIEASAGFYRDLLGFTETFRTPRQGAPVHIEPHRQHDPENHEHHRPAGHQAAPAAQPVAHCTQKGHPPRRR
jgi:catechol 2,3-dioxygenase-like lactoylglutathione lyase family enzyme